jgi:hypothetical protein
MTMMNFHSHKPRTICDWIIISLSYVPCFIVFVLEFIILYPYFMFFIFDMLSLRKDSSRAEWLLYWYSLLGELFLTFMLDWSFLATIWTCPGYPDVMIWRNPPHPINSTEGLNPGAANLNIVEESGRAGELRYCSKCSMYKPDNSHHCSECEHCVLGMDHHCPWINNCVGERNQKHFTLFISYVALMGVHILLTATLAAYVVPNHSTAKPDVLSVVLAFIGILGAGILGFVLGGFSIVQWLQMSEGTSTLERKFGKVKMGKVQKTDSDEEEPRKKISCWKRRFDNCKAVMGPDWRRWWLPIPAYPIPPAFDRANYLSVV